MNEKEIIEKISIILQGQKFRITKEKTDKINGHTSLINHFSLDSLQILELIIEIEQVFQFSCSARELNIDMFDNMGKLIELIQEKVKKQAV